MMTKPSGFNLLELTLVLALTSIFSVLLLANYFALVRSSSLNKSDLDTALKQQQLTYFFRQMLSSAGQYNKYDSRLELNDDKEEALLVNHPIVLPNSFQTKPELGIADGESDAFVINLLSDIGCNGRKFNYQGGELFHLVNEIFVQDNVLKCRSYDGRFLTGLKKAKSRWTSVSLLNGVKAMQVSYLVRGGTKVQYIDASKLNHQHSIAAVKLELWFTETDALLNKLRSSLSIFDDEDEGANLNSRYRRMMLLLPLTVGDGNG